jgi:cellulose synthase/poly-beta-1,6-N-acetylglucosamine synthase-like glycosyltransferase
LEEANSDVVNWVKQRSRWYKGYFQTLVVHTRQPGRLVAELGWRPAAGFLLFVGGTPLLALLNPLLWLLSGAVLLSGSSWLAGIFPSPLYHLEMLVWAGGVAASMYCSLLAARERGRQSSVLALLALPAYWVLMSVAAVKAAAQLVTAPSYWEKTVHGLDQAP